MDTNECINHCKLCYDIVCDTPVKTSVCDLYAIYRFAIIIICVLRC